MSGSNPESENPLAKEFFEQYGKTLSEWASLEHVLSLWFNYAIRMPQGGIGISRAIFYSGRNFDSRRNLILSALSQYEPPSFPLKFPNMPDGPNESERIFLKAAIKLAFTYSRERNRLAHRLAVHNTTEEKFELVEGDAWHMPGIDIEELRIIERNFSILKTILVKTLPRPTQQIMLPQEALQLILSMPSEASSLQPREKRSERRRRSQSSPP
jgi:hypothetical protein